jgi:ABC-type antimicrobial peptide transport system permease subunit
MEEVIGASTSAYRLRGLLCGIFAGIALILAGAGVYAVVSYSVTSRTRELGIRSALGASPGEILRMVLRRVMLLAFAGTILGVALSLGLNRFIASLLFGVNPSDALTIAVAATVVISAALLASTVPALAASKVDPSVALRHE